MKKALMRSGHIKNKMKKTSHPKVKAFNFLNFALKMQSRIHAKNNT